MNRLQKQSWIMVVSIGIAFFASCIVVAYWAASKGFPDAFQGFIFTCTGCLGYFAGLFVKKDKPVIVDERDLAIKALAKTNTFIASFIFLVLLSMGIFIYKKPGNPISVNVLPLCVCLTCVIAGLVESLTYIIEYGKDNKLPEGGAA